MNRERTAWMVSVLLIALLALRSPSGLAQRDSDYGFVRTMVDIHRQVVNNYVEPIDQERLHESAIQGMLSQLDPFSMYVPPARQKEFDRALEGAFEGVGIQLNQAEDGTIEVVTPIDGSPAFKAGVRAGDIVLEVNGQSVQGLRLQEIVSRITGKLGTEVRIKVRHPNGVEEILSMARQHIVVPTLKGYRRNPDASWDYYVSKDPKIAYLRLTQFTPETAQTLRSILTPLLADGMKGLVLDLRFNPGGRLDEAEEVVDLFIDSGVIVRTKGRNRPERVRMARPNDTLPHFPMVVLVNEHSASAAEVVAGSLRDNNRALVVGTRTYGKGSVQEVIPLEDSSGELKLTVAYYYLPKGRLVHRKKDATDWGVEPQINVPLDESTAAWVLQDQFEQDLIRGAAAPAATMPSTQPTTQRVDTQLQTAVSTLLGFIIFGGNPETAALAPTTATTETDVEDLPELEYDPTTAPATGPSTNPTRP